MKKLIAILSLTIPLISSCTTNGFEPGSIAVIPAPVSVQKLKGQFTINERTSIIVTSLDSETIRAVNLISRLFENATGKTFVSKKGLEPRRHSIFFAIDSTIENSEGYNLSITGKNIILRAKTPAGLFYGAQTLRQLMPAGVEAAGKVNGAISVPACQIADEPSFRYRGLHLDVSRHMIPSDTIKRMIDAIALHKMNRLHIHLTDDQGWRIEIKKYPLLTKIGAYRKETVAGHQGKEPYTYDGKPYGGYYTQEQMKDIVAYAYERFITVIPEIEMPGHALSALAAYPELSCTGGPFEVRRLWGIEENVFCAGKENTFSFLEDVLSEIMDIFPSNYIHIGGDECPKARWEKCPLCQARLKKEGFSDEQELQSYFIKRIEQFLTSKGRNLIGWDEILEGGLAPGATVMSWRGTKGGIEAAKMGHDVIMTPINFTYLNYYQAEPENEPMGYPGYLPLENVYSYNPYEGIGEEEKKHILGVQGNLWTEYVTCGKMAEYMAFPRAFAIAESGWTPNQLKNLDDFIARLKVQNARYTAMGLVYFKGEYRNIHLNPENK